MKGASSHAGRSSGCQRGTDLVPSPKSLRWYPICTALAIRLCPRHCSWDSGFSGSKYRPTDRHFQKNTLPLPPNQVHTATTYTMHALREFDQNVYRDAKKFTPEISSPAMSRNVTRKYDRYRCNVWCYGCLHMPCIHNYDLPCRRGLAIGQRVMQTNSSIHITSMNVLVLNWVVHTSAPNNNNSCIIGAWLALGT